MHETEPPTRQTRRTGSVPTLESGFDEVMPRRDEAPTLPAGTEVGRYVIEERIGVGGMGVVFRARDPALDRVVALKCLRPELVALRGAGRLMREARGLAQLAHPNVVAIYDVERWRGGVVIAMEHVRGQTLREWLDRARPWPELVARFHDAGRGLAAAHAAGLVHRDFKPSNVLVGDDGRVRVMDFGLVRADRGRDSSLRSSEISGVDEPVMSTSPSSAEVHAPDDDRTEAGMVMGTPAYMAPEQLCGEEADARCDQFAFCVSLWEALCGQRPYGGGVEQSTRAKLEGPPPWPTMVGVPRALAELVRRGLAPRPEDRWPSMDVLLHRLARIVPGGRLRRTSGARWVLGTTVIVAGLVGLGLWQAPALTSPCTGGRERLAAVWDTGRAEAVRSRLELAGAVHLEETWPRVQQRLDAYAEGWAAAHTEACEATTVRAEVEPAVLDQRMACLERARVELRAMVQLLADPQADVAGKAVALVASLPSPAHCIEPPATHGELPRPSDPAVATEVDALRDGLTEVEALQLSRAHDEALAKLEPLVERAHALEQGSIEGVALFRRGRLHEARGDYAAAEADLLRAHALGVEHDYPKLVQQAASQLAFLVGHRLARPEDGLRWANAGVAEAQRMAEAQGVSGSALEADARQSLAVVLHMQGRYDEAVLEQRRALALLERAALAGRDDADELELASAIDALGNMVQEQGKHGEAAELHRSALEIRERELGPSHLDVAMTLNNLGSTLMVLGRDAEAVGYLRRTLEIRERVLGPDDPALVSVLVNLGALLSDGVQPRDGEPYLQRGLAIATARLGEDHPYVGSALHNLGLLYDHADDRQAAREHFRRAMDTWEHTLGPDHPKLALALDSLGDLALAEGTLDEAARHHARALAIREAALGDAHPLVAESLTAVGRVRLAEGKADEALAHGRRALVVLGRSSEPNAEHAAQAHALAGRALLALGRADEAKVELDTAVRLHPALAQELDTELPPREPTAP